MSAQLEHLISCFIRASPWVAHSLAAWLQKSSYIHVPLHGLPLLILEYLHLKKKKKKRYVGVSWSLYDTKASGGKIIGILGLELELVGSVGKYNCFSCFSLCQLWMHEHTHTDDAKQHSGSSKLHRGNYASSDALLLCCQLMVTEHLEWFFLWGI